MWNAITHLFAHVLTLGWFIGAILMLVTIPACMYKIFSALWEDDSPDDERPSYDKAVRA